MTWLTAMEYLCHKWPGICSTCGNHFPVLSSFMTYHRVCNKINTTGTTSGAGAAYPSTTPEFTPDCRSLFVLLSFFSFGHCFFCPSSIYGFWLPFGIFKFVLKDYVFSCILPFTLIVLITGQLWSWSWSYLIFVFTTTYSNSVYHHKSWEFESR